MCKIQNANGKAFLNFSKFALQSNFVTQAFCAFDYNNLILSKGEKMAINLNEANFNEHRKRRGACGFLGGLVRTLSGGFADYGRAFKGF